MNRKKIAVLILSLCILLLGCVGCGQNEKPVVSMYDLSRAMLAADDTLPEMSYISSSDENASELFTYISDLDYALVDSYFLSYSSKGLADEIAVIALKNEADVAAAMKTIESHVQERTAMYRQYDPSQMDRVEGGLVFTSGRYAVLIISDKQKEVKSAFEGFINE